MYHHIKKLMYTVNVGTPDVKFGKLLLEQFGGANGELAAAMQYTIQGWNCVDDLARRDLLLDIGTEELSHLEVVGAFIRMHLKDLKTDREAAEADPLVYHRRWRRRQPLQLAGSTPGPPTTSRSSGELDVDLRSDIAAEARAKIVYERLIDHTDDPGSIDTLQFLMTREITHLKAFTAALESIEKSPFSIGFLKPTPGIVDECFNASTVDGDEGDPRYAWPLADLLRSPAGRIADARGPRLSIDDIHGTDGKEDRGKLDSGQRQRPPSSLQLSARPNPVPTSVVCMQRLVPTVIARPTATTDAARRRRQIA